ncbi:hypothetical protein, partial [Methylobacterium sp. WL9]|uniref:hypothetical protein n=1 Tax=Methylobacterium sp. WL9 TaxID=2603898 RepID=UPI0011CB1856
MNKAPQTHYGATAAPAEQHAANPFDRLDPSSNVPAGGAKVPRIVNFEGRRIQVTDDATDDEIASILDPAPAPPAGTFEDGS